MSTCFQKLVDNLVQTISVVYKELYDTMRTVQMEQIMLAKTIEKEIESEYSSLLKKHGTMKKYIQELEKKCEQPVCEFLQVREPNSSVYLCLLGSTGPILVNS